MNASPDRTALMRQREEEKAKALRRAVDDVMDGVVPLCEAYRNRGVDYDALRAELERRGWQSRVKNPPGPRRRTFGDGKRKGT